MSILSTDKKLISFGTDYSAGSGISIIDHTISVIPSAVGKTYSAGPNIGIYKDEGQLTISSKDWTQDIDQSSSGAVTESIAYFNDWINGQYTGDITNITNNITALSGDLSAYYKKTETSSKAEISAALDYVSAHAVGDVEVNDYVHNNSATIDEVNSAYQSNSASYLTAVNIPESATWNDTSNVVSSNSAQWSQGKTYEGISPIVVNNYENKISASTWTLTAGNGISFVEDSANNITRIDCTASGDAGVNSFVTNNSASILEVNSSYKQNSATFLTAIPSDLATTGDVANLEQTISETYYPKTNPSSFATVDWVLGQGYLTEHQDISNKLDSSAFSSVSGDFLTTAFSIPESATWTDTSNVVQTNSAQWAEGGGSVSSKYGTITVDGSDIEATNSAVEFKSEGFKASFDDIFADEFNPRTFTWDDYSEGTTFMSRILNQGNDSAAVLTYSSNTNVTGNITIPQWQTSSVILQLPNATAVQFTITGRGIYRLSNIEVSATSSNQVKELAWKNDLPTYSYNSNNKLSAINGSALVGNEDYLVQQGFVQNLSSPFSTINVKDNKVEATNSAIKSDTYIEGFVSAYNNILVSRYNSATLTWANYVPNTKLYVSARENWQEDTFTYSANTDVTGTITVSTAGQANIEVPTDSTSIVIGNSGYDYYNFTVSAEDYYKVGELAWKTDVPSFEAGPGIKVTQPSAGVVRIGSDETVLWSGDAGTATNLVLTENYTNFDRLRFEYRPWSTGETPSYQISEVGTTYNNFTLGSFWNNNTTYATFIYTYQGNGTNQINFIRGAFNNGINWTTAGNIHMFKVVGLGRKENA